MDSKKTEVLYDHYKNTCETKDKTIKLRNKHFIDLCIVQVINLLMTIKPYEIFEMVSKGFGEKMGFKLMVGNNILQSLMWVITIYVSIRYIQDVLSIERNYKYINFLEKEISSSLDTKVFSKEGYSYSKNYPNVLNFIDIFYKFLMPVVFIAIITFQIVKEFYQLDLNLIWYVIFDLFIYISLVIIAVSYFLEIHPGIVKSLQKNKVLKSFGDWLETNLRRI